MVICWLRAALISCLAGIVGFHAVAQGISGRIVNEKSAPVEFANVMLLNPVDSAYMDGCVTDTTGSFLLHATHPGLLKVSCLGFEDKFLPDAIGSLGIIVLASGNVELGEVVVTAQRALTKLEGDALVTKVQGSPLEHAGTATDVLCHVPGIVKGSDGLEVIGKGTPLVYINGKLVRDDAELDRLASSQVKDVEVVTTPGAKYDASVNSVIRIATVRNEGEGFGFGSRTMLGVQRYVYGLEQFDFNYQNNGFNLFGMLDYENYRDRSRYTKMQETFSSQYLQHDASGADYNKMQVYAGKLGFDCSVFGNHNFGMFYDYSYRPSDGYGLDGSTVWADGSLSDELKGTTNTAARNRQHTASGYFIGKFGKWQLDVNADAVWQNRDNDQHVVEVSTTGDDRSFATANHIDSRLIAGKAMLSRDMWKGSVSVGAEYTSVCRNDSYVSGASFISSVNTHIDEANFAAFAEATQTFGKLTASAGLRWEHVNSRYYENTVKQEAQSRIYDDFFPSLMASFPIGAVKTRWSYSRKVSRPVFEQLRNNVSYLDRYNYESGNPYLKPIYRDYVSLTAAYKEFSVAIDYVHVKDYYMWVHLPYEGNPEIALLQMQNMKTFSTVSAMVNYAPVFGCYHPSLMLAIDKQFFEIPYRDGEKDLGNPIGIIRFDNAINLPFDSWLNADLFWRSAGNGENMYIKSTFQFDLGWYKSFLKDRWSVKLQCTDVFNTARLEFDTFDSIRKTGGKKLTDTRKFEITVRFKFNAAKEKYRGQNAGESERSRL